MPAVLLHFFEVAGKMLPAIGFAMLMKQSISENWMIALFLLGWVVVGATGMSITSLAIIASAIAILFVISQGKLSVNATTVAQEEGNDYDE